MKYEDWDDEAKIKEVYLSEIADNLCGSLDTTVPWALNMVRSLNPEKADEILKHRVQCVNVWKPLVGPVKDWPLAMCEPRTLQPDRDLEPCDLVYPDYVVENQQVYYSDEFEWFYISDQEPNEAWVFLQSDTDPGGKPGMLIRSTKAGETDGSSGTYVLSNAVPE
ncbi:putative -like methyltransferase protein [Neofusicoccum parvum UCRNP2]|uniref:Putative-like methyltransferase protein n=1 Tax=Botryosphaeria parva (strain UCR-NP2) TaxID=1287680 RepID=R1ESB6_BOTPV|nr:putative -like methyltransferase protein [Neofusicoccum parvum UCRNP2]